MIHRKKDEYLIYSFNDAISWSKEQHVVHHEHQVELVDEHAHEKLTQIVQVSACYHVGECDPPSEVNENIDRNRTLLYTSCRIQILREDTSTTFILVHASPSLLKHQLPYSSDYFH